MIYKENTITWCEDTRNFYWREGEMSFETLKEAEKAIDKQMSFQPVEVYRWRAGYVRQVEGEAELITVTARDFRNGGFYMKTESGKREKVYSNESLYEVTPENEAIFSEMEACEVVIHKYVETREELRKQLTEAELI